MTSQGRLSVPVVRSSALGSGARLHKLMDGLSFVWFLGGFEIRTDDRALYTLPPPSLLPLPRNSVSGARYMGVAPEERGFYLPCRARELVKAIIVVFMSLY